MSAPVDPWAPISRTEISFSLTASRHRHSYKVVNQLTPDDLIDNMARAEAHLVNTGEDLTYYPDPRVVDYLLRSNVVLRGS
jgi:hypothetical protein